MSFSLFKIHPQRLAEQLAAAQAEVKRAKEAWEGAGFGKTNPQTLHNQSLEVHDLGLLLREKQTEFMDWREKKLEVDHEVTTLRQRKKIWQFLQSTQFPVLVGFFGSLLGLLLGFLIGTIASIALGFLCVVSVFSLAGLAFAWWFHFKGYWMTHKVVELGHQVSGALIRLNETALRMTQARDSQDQFQRKWERSDKLFKQMEHAAKLQKTLEDALQNYDQILDAIQSKKHQLFHSNWRNLRGIPFEEFLREVFEIQGYTVQMTKASGDKGLDLILTGQGRKIGIQAKGSDGKVGIDAVQEAHFGITFYCCDCSAVITNSYFTPAAKDAAARANCSLISADDILDLIDGKITL